MLYSVKSVKEIQDLNPFIVVGCGGGGEKFSNFEGVEAVGFIDDNVNKQGKDFCGHTVAGSLEECLEAAPEAICSSGYRCRIECHHFIQIIISQRKLIIEEICRCKKCCY